MNIKITHNWLLEYLDTDASPDEIREYLSLCGPSIESVEKMGDDYVYDIEVISNRIDYASVLGIAREAAAILPMFGKKVKLLKDYLSKSNCQSVKSELKLEIQDSKNLCPRKLAVVMDVKVSQSPGNIKNRLEACGIRSLNNIIDVTNYVMLETGHPTHVFDFDRVKTGKIIVRKAKTGEKITTLDGKEYILNSNDIVFDDGSGRIIDLPGIMGLKNSVVTEKTKRIIFWIETNDPKAIRQTSMRLGIRTVAASINEKNPDPSAAAFALLKGIEFYKKIASAKIISPIYDTNPQSEKQKTIDFDYKIFKKIIGVEIDKKTINNILTRLGFKIISSKILVPSHREHDISISEDLVEEVARVYGYRNIPSVLQPAVYVEQPKEMEDIFVFQNKIKLLLKHLGLNEMINYSMVSKDQLINFGLDPKKHLRLSNTLSEDIEYLRTCLTISLLKNIKENTGKKEMMKLFEIGKVYLPKNGELPDEVYKIGIATNTDYFDLKGIIEAIYKELNILDPSVPEITEIDGVFLAEINLQELINNSRSFPTYKPINPYAVIKLDKTFDLEGVSRIAPTTYAEIEHKAFKSKLLQKIVVKSLYQNKLTLRFYYSSSERNITEKEAKEELDKV